MDYDIRVETGTFDSTSVHDFTTMLPPAEYAKGKVFEFIFGFRRNSNSEKLNVNLSFEVPSATTPDVIEPTIKGSPTERVRVKLDSTKWSEKDTVELEPLNLFTTVTTVNG